MDRALREFRIRGVKTNIPFLENVIHHPTFRIGRGDDDVHRHDAGAVPVQAAPRPRHQAAQLSSATSSSTATRTRRAQLDREALLPAPIAARYDSQATPPPGTRAAAAGTRAEEIRRVDAQAEAPADHRHDVARRAPVAAGHARAHLRHAARSPTPSRACTPQPVQPRDVGRRDVRHVDALPAGRPVAAPARSCASAIPNILLPDAAPRRATPSATRTIPTTSSRGFVEARRRRAASTSSASSTR